MKITCEYCDSYFEAGNMTKCPNCGAPIGRAIKAETERQEQIRREAEEKAETARKEAEDAELRNTILKAGLGMLGAGIASGLSSRTLRKTAGSAIKRYIQKELK